MLFDVTNLTSMWSLVTEGGGFNISDIVAFVKENIGTFVSVSTAFIILHKFHYRNICEVWLAFLSRRVGDILFLGVDPVSISAGVAFCAVG